MALTVLDREIQGLLSNDLKRWGKDIASQLAMRVNSMTVGGKVGLLKAMNNKVSRIYGKFKKGTFIISGEKKLSEDIQGNQKWADGKRSLIRVSFSFPRHGVFFQNGVSKYHTKKNPMSGKDWYNSIINSNQDSLADIIVLHSADAILNFTSALIKPLHQD